MQVLDEFVVAGVVVFGGVVELDFDLLDVDYAHIKRVFVGGGVGNRSSVRLGRLMALLERANVSTVRLSNVAVTTSTLDCIISYILCDDHYGADSLLKAYLTEFGLLSLQSVSARI